MRELVLAEAPLSRRLLTPFSRSAARQTRRGGVRGLSTNKICDSRRRGGGEMRLRGNERERAPGGLRVREGPAPPPAWLSGETRAPHLIGTRSIA
ncbi:hypothetical protein EVAR_21163_1 [Eumeta japonica]|uniref:Uncharacterized protein n=1 Tax=Eumeta variegata TaxID=151549 RepID=A0A4C1UQC1_EUMVA|nr:hypothetical protein EVAR_21163_1 [Eumeta japonica]